MDLTVSDSWKHEPALDAILFDVEDKAHHVHHIGIKIDAIAKLADITSASPEAMETLYLENLTKILPVVEKKLSSLGLEHGLLMLQPSDFREHHRRHRPVAWTG